MRAPKDANVTVNEYWRLFRQPFNEWLLWSRHFDLLSDSNWPHSADRLTGSVDRTMNERRLGASLLHQVKPRNSARREMRH